MENGLFTVNNECVSRVMAPLKADNRCGLLSQQVNDFPLTLIAPLGAEYDDISTHYCFSSGSSSHSLLRFISCCVQR